MALISVLLATYNSERFLHEQLTSLAAQTFQDFSIDVADDGSTDATLDILQEFAATSGLDIRIRQNDPPSGGACANFQGLIARSDADYCLLCDHDDIWEPNKIEKMVAAMMQAEQDVRPDTPILIFSDLSVIDAERAQMHRSFWQFHAIDPATSVSFTRSLVNAVVVGCSTIFNRPLIDKAVPIPDDVIMHDWWLHLVATEFGAVRYLDDPLVQYRQHGENVSGSSDRRLSRVMRMEGKIARVRRSMTNRYRQARVFLDAHGDNMRPAHRKHLETFVQMQDMGFIRRRYTFLRNNFTHNGFLKNVATLVFM